MRLSLALVLAVSPRSRDTCMASRRARRLATEFRTPLCEVSHQGDEITLRIFGKQGSIRPRADLLLLPLLQNQRVRFSCTRTMIVAR